MPLDHGRTPRSRRRGRLVDAVLRRSPAPPVLVDQIVHLDRRRPRDRRRAAVAGRPRGRRTARPCSGRHLRPGPPRYRPPPALNDSRTRQGQPRGSVATRAERSGEGLPARTVCCGRGNTARLRQRDHLRPRPHGRACDGPRPPRIPRRAPVQADGHRPRRMGPGCERRRVRIPRPTPDHRGHRRLRRTAPPRRPLGRPTTRPERMGRSGNQTPHRHPAPPQLVTEPRFRLRLRLPVLDLPPRLLRPRFPSGSFASSSRPTTSSSP
jgi:hypothetical protein